MDCALGKPPFIILASSLPVLVAQDGERSKYAQAPLHGRSVMADDLLLQIENKGRTANMNLHLWVIKLISIELYHHSVLCLTLLHTTKI